MNERVENKVKKGNENDTCFSFFLPRISKIVLKENVTFGVRASADAFFSKSTSSRRVVFFLITLKKKEFNVKHV